MNTTPLANRKHIALVGKTNAGKSSLLNALVGQEVSLVSQVSGTTADPVIKPVELIPFGPVAFIDTAGLEDQGELGTLRVEKTLKFLKRADLALYVVDARERAQDLEEKAARLFKPYHLPYILVFNKVDLLSPAQVAALKKAYPKALLVSAVTGENLAVLKEEIIKALEEGEEERPLVGDLVPPGGRVLLVVPVDSAAPKGRLILPQVQLIRDCLDHGVKCYVVRDQELSSALSDLSEIHLVVTDSQVFKKVAEMIPQDIFLTSFSILFARYKGDLEAFVAGASKIPELADGSRILIAESCSHNLTHEDIGRVKLPTLLRKFTGKQLVFDFKAGHDFPEDLTGYDLVIHCGACMFNRKAMLHRIWQCQRQQIPITNYGVALAFLNGILDRTLEIFKET